ncbi:MAG: DUF6314 family protein [Jhaorihella sp.]
MSLPLTLSDFAGGWRLSRRIEDAHAGQVIEAEGRASLTEDGEGRLCYLETLRLFPPGQAPLTGTRRYLWQAQAPGIAVRFEDGRPFHRIALGQADPGDVHDCPPDRYAVRYGFGQWPRWCTQWHVRGPRKDYAMWTEYRRDPSPGAGRVGK